MDRGVALDSVDKMIDCGLSVVLMGDLSARSVALDILQRNKIKQIY